MIVKSCQKAVLPLCRLIKFDIFVRGCNLSIRI